MSNLALIFDPLFHLPFLNGLLLVPLAALLGAYLRLREEWLASLAFAQVAAAGGILSVLFHVPMLLAAVITAILAGIGKGLLQRAGNDNYAILILLGWSVALLIAANSPHGEMLGKALMDGQLYFTGWSHGVSALLLAVALLVVLPWLSPRLLLGRLFPDHFTANDLPGRRYHLIFDLLVVTVLAVTTTAVGVMATFALVFIPSWIAFRLAPSWRATLWLSGLLALGAYLVAFVAAILLDQPFGPVLVAVLVLLAPLRFFQPGQHQRNSAAAGGGAC
ncbi:zinc transport system permease protein [Geoalkalibacter ferrihydriticus]|uniref:ABC transporter n=2 Tax=Geoalkalibacter ferrihydriticus TaxID=392333 RepID=A0A0C2HT14_9BACT|nr:metal ABC transporter permease [Geoalkalibacter ferrihydriticus]KIH75932.1 ABC transporter [Geoalkalibacter ferrihydriticus DSM 17813]SDM55916.1 zinc transport system permease protein [Geoalkalibacter ferrihydriticus]